MALVVAVALVLTVVVIRDDVGETRKQLAS